MSITDLTAPFADLLIRPAWAQAGGEGGGLIALLPMVLIFVIFYFLLIRPQQKRAKEHRALVADLSKGDEIMTSGGLVGRITDTDENFIVAEIADKVEVRLQRMSVVQMLPKGTFKNTAK